MLTDEDRRVLDLVRFLQPDEVPESTLAALRAAFGRADGEEIPTTYGQLRRLDPGWKPPAELAEKFRVAAFAAGSARAGRHTAPASTTAAMFSGPVRAVPGLEAYRITGGPPSQWTHPDDNAPEGGDAA